MINSPMLIGLVSDTHGYIDPRLFDALTGCEAIIHAGDVGSIPVLDALNEMVPVYAVQGNNDVPFGGFGLPTHRDIELGGVWFHIVHELPQARPTTLTNAIVCGHSHRLLNEVRGGVLYLNPGAAGVVGFHRELTAMRLRVEAGAIDVEVVTIGARPSPAERKRVASKRIAG